MVPSRIKRLQNTKNLNQTPKKPLKNMDVFPSKATFNLGGLRTLYSLKNYLGNPALTKQLLVLISIDNI
jgi:hypothetical protein